MASALSTAGKNAALTAIGATYGFAAAYTGDPGATGTENEVAGGTYARKAITWGNAANGQIALATFPAFDIPAGTTVAYVGLWTLAVGGSYGGCWDVTDEAFAAAGTYTLTAGTISL